MDVTRGRRGDGGARAEGKFDLCAQKFRPADAICRVHFLSGSVRKGKKEKGKNPPVFPASNPSSVK